MLMPMRGRALRFGSQRRALERPLELLYPIRERNVQRHQRCPPEHAVDCEAVPVLELTHTRGERGVVASGGRRRIGRQVTERDEQTMQRGAVAVARARERHKGR